MEVWNGKGIMEIGEEWWRKWCRKWRETHGQRRNGVFVLWYLQWNEMFLNE